jgi:hypothetical protein
MASSFAFMQVVQGFLGKLFDFAASAGQKLLLGIEARMVPARELFTLMPCYRGV